MAAKTLLSPTAVNREALRVLHQKLNFVGTITREYDESFCRQGAKVGDTMHLHPPGTYAFRGEAPAENTMTAVKVTAQRGVDLNFTAVDLAMPLDDFSDRVLEPAMGTLAKTIETEAMAMYRDVYNQVNNHGQSISFTRVLQGRKTLVDNLAPLSGRTCSLNPQDTLDLGDALKGLFNDRDNLSKQYREGFMGRTAGFDFMEKASWPDHDPASGIGNVFTMPGVYRVHPETKQSTGVLQQFVTTEDGFSPPIITQGPDQNVSSTPHQNAARVYPAEHPHGISMAYHKSAFLFGTADMVMPRGVEFASRELFDGISMRLVRQYDINADRYSCRLDLLFGFKTVRPQLACRIASGAA